ncbi:hypothetical protein NIES4102_41600 (plasmid) [Chondrocystis sp. NIES-4102]|nr:hypothetical protein NIES4102_41600 [Chondrocystis sp. NIES-4102]
MYKILTQIKHYLTYLLHPNSILLRSVKNIIYKDILLSQVYGALQFPKITTEMQWQQVSLLNRGVPATNKENIDINKLIKYEINYNNNLQRFINVTFQIQFLLSLFLIRFAQIDNINRFIFNITCLVYMTMTSILGSTSIACLYCINLRIELYKNIQFALICEK